MLSDSPIASKLSLERCVDPSKIRCQLSPTRGSFIKSLLEAETPHQGFVKTQRTASLRFP